jgi:hypothetical protein
LNVSAYITDKSDTSPRAGLRLRTVTTLMICPAERVLVMVAVPADAACSAATADQALAVVAGT